MAASNQCGDISARTEVAVPTKKADVATGSLPVTGADLGLVAIWATGAIVLGGLLGRKRRTSYPTSDERWTDG